jgi:hypothetical protein
MGQAGCLPDSRRDAGATEAECTLAAQGDYNMRDVERKPERVACYRAG